MVKRYPDCLKIFLASILITFLPKSIFSQIDADLTTSPNSICNGTGCDYDGPSILINELMLSPSANDGSMWGGNSNQAGEWIELYNPDICFPVDISCYFLGNNANDGGAYPGGYLIPDGTIIPPSGFALIRGVNAAPVPTYLLVENGGNVVELVVTGDGVCVGGGNRLWFPNAGGWFAFYDANGIPQDAVSWANQSNTDQYPCVPTLPGCNYNGSLPNYDEIDSGRKEYILNVSAATFQGQSLRRIPDGGAWDVPAAPTYATCNATCIDDVPICSGTATASVTPSGGVPPYTYLWDDPLGQTSSTASNLCAGNYCVTITDSNGDTFQECITVEDVIYTTEINDGFCEGSTYTLPDNSTTSVEGTYSFTYQSIGECDSIVTVNLSFYENYSFTIDAEICENRTYVLPDGTEISSPGTYFSNFQTVNGCDSTYTVNLTVLPPIPVNLDAQICSGSNYILPDGSSVSAEGTYQVLMPGTEEACDTLYTVNLGFYPDIEIQISDVSDISCFGEEDGFVNLLVSGGTQPYNFTWSDGIDHGSSANNLGGGEYNVIITDVNGCTNDTSFTILEPDLLELTLTGDTLICFGVETVLTALATGGTGNYLFNWSGSGSTEGSIAVQPDSLTTYSVFVEDENGCTSPITEIEIDVINLYSENLTVSNDTSICPGESVEIAAFYSGNYTPYQYQWSSEELAGSGPHLVSPTISTTYNISVSDDCGNSIADSISIQVFDIPVADLPDVLLSGCSPLETVLSDTINNGTGLTHEWSLSNGISYTGNPVDITIEDPGLYEVFLTISTEDGCSVSSQNAIPIEVYELPIAGINASAWTAGIEDPSITFINESEGDVLNVWTINSETFENFDQVSYLFPDTGSYAVELYVENEFGCADSILRWIEIEVEYDITIPTAFTPGGNGDDPYYDPESTSNTIFYPFAEYVDEFRMSIFNRWGEMIFESTEIEKGWNGTYRDQPCPMDVYVYRIDFVFADGNQITKVGDITLLR